MSTPYNTFFSKSRTPFLFSVVFLIWTILFFDFLSGKLMLVSDAIPYYENFKFYIDQISRGVMPLWDPTRDWGTPNEFFLRRIGEFNPFYLILIVLYKMGMPFRFAYPFFLAFYYFLAVIGFYAVAERILKRADIAFLGAVILMFSSMSSILFRSFIVLVLVPMIWFLYFLLEFSDLASRRSFLGMVFTLMLIVTTYIPFYFLTIFLVFLISCSVFYFKETIGFVKKLARFVRKNPVFTGMCLIILLLSLLPGALFYFESGRGELVMPGRHEDSALAHSVSVAEQSVVTGGIPSLGLSEILKDLRLLNVGDIFIPAIAYIIFLLGIILKTNKRVVLILFMMFWVHVISLYDATPVYPFLYDHVFFFKFFRNFQFFIWLVLMPAFVFICTEFFSSVPEPEGRTGQERKKIFLLYVVFIHLLLAGYYLMHQHVSLTTYAAIAGSCGGWACYVQGIFKKGRWPLVLILSALVIIQSAQAAKGITHNSQKKTGPYRYEKPYMAFQLPDGSTSQNNMDTPAVNEGRAVVNKVEPSTANHIYAGTVWADLLVRFLDTNLMEDYYKRRIVLYDRTEPVRDDQLDSKRIGEAFLDNENIAFVSWPNAEGAAAPIGPHARIITEGAEDLKVLKFDVNEAVFKVKLDSRKFLVYNDNYYRGWHAEIDGREEKLYRANVAFKGLWVPAGEHVIRFYFGQRWEYILKYILIIIFQCVLWALVVLSIKQGKAQKGIMAS